MIAEYEVMNEEKVTQDRRAERINVDGEKKKMGGTKGSKLTL